MKVRYIAAQWNELAETPAFAKLEEDTLKDLRNIYFLGASATILALSATESEAEEHKVYRSIETELREASILASNGACISGNGVAH